MPGQIRPIKAHVEHEITLLLTLQLRQSSVSMRSKPSGSTVAQMSLHACNGQQPFAPQPGLGNNIKER
jgi:hypothetical protein